MPYDTTILTSSHLRVIASALQQIEEVVCSRSNGRPCGPMITSLSVVGFNCAKKSFFDVLSRGGVVLSYQTIYNWREAEIAERIAVGPFTTLSPGVFFIVGVENINIRTKNQLAIYGGT